uniref:Aldehyde dehydrogenase domain-containing protein n=1 Tax=Timema cristinae TaxID=61476 RepID=A0A7R9CB88_TIMCR|nr:unnamed protein product [Timema cristinae]
MANNNSYRKNIYEIYKTMEYGPVLDSASLGEAWLKGRKFGPFIDGSWIQESGGRKEIHNPCTGHHIATVVNSSQGDVDRAVASSATAFLSWKQLSGYDRAKYLYSLARHLQKNVSLLVQVESLNRGVQTSDPREFDVPAAVRHFYHYAGWAQLIHSDLKGWEPQGVVVGILSSCCPLAMLAWIIAPALAAGNTVCLRPSIKTPLPAMLLAHIAIEAGLPAGVLNMLPGGSDVAQQLILHNDVAHITFSGQTSIGRQIIQATAGCSKKLTMLLSGRTPMLVFDTADIDSASDSILKDAWFNQGQVPWAVTQLLVQESIFKDFAEKLKKRLNKVAIGRAFDKMADIGQPCSSQTVVNVRQAITKAVEKGLEVFQVKVPDHLSQDLFFPPTLVFGGQLESNQVVGEDTIAPVVTVTPFRTTKEAIALANNTRYGVAASVWTENAALALEVAAHLEVACLYMIAVGMKRS